MRRGRAPTGALDFSPAQANQLAQLSGAAKTRLQQVYMKQNAGQVPGQSRDAKIKAAQARIRQQYAPLRNMPAPRGTAARGQMPDLSHGNWAQTPAASGYLAPRGFGYYDAFTHDPYSAGTHLSIGPATPIVGSTICSKRVQTVKSNVLTGTGTGVGLEGGSFLVIVYPCTGATQAKGYACSSDDAGDGAYLQFFESPQLNSESPLDAIPTRCSVRIRNTTQSVAQGGLVRVLRMCFV
jgi:hypothetical protein